MNEKSEVDNYNDVLTEVIAKNKLPDVLPFEDQVMFTICEFYHITLDQIKSKSRKREHVLARQIAMVYFKEKTDYSLKRIGSLFENRDHSTVIHAIQAIQNLLDTDKKFIQQHKQIIELLTPTPCTTNQKEE
jgi:chromosomal replication initiation ATPase DnaA